MGLVAVIGAVVMGLIAVAKAACGMIKSAIAGCIFPTLAMCGIKPPGGGGGSGPLILPDPPPCPEELKDGQPLERHDHAEWQNHRSNR